MAPRSAGLGALLALIAVGQNLNVIGIIAIILLIGIVKKNGIMIVDVALRLEREQKLTGEEAVRQVSSNVSRDGILELAWCGKSAIKRAAIVPCSRCADGPSGSAAIDEANL